MNISLSIPAQSLRDVTTFSVKIPRCGEFPVLVADRGTYMVHTTLEAGIDAASKGYAEHNVQIGRFCAIAHGLTLMTGMNHGYTRVAMGEPSWREDGRISPEGGYMSNRKERGEILIQNDVWIGRNATIMPGVVIRNGAIIAANSHVVKDVPPYAIVGGNPARILKYRFSKTIIEKLQTIQWWYWTEDQFNMHRKWFSSERVGEFCDCFALSAAKDMACLPDIPHDVLSGFEGKRYLFFMDYEQVCSIWQQVVREFSERFMGNEYYRLLLVMPENMGSRKIEVWQNILKAAGVQEEVVQHQIRLIDIDTENERALFRHVDCWITNRDKRTIMRSCYSDENHVNILSGVDWPIFIGE